MKEMFPEPVYTAQAGSGLHLPSLPRSSIADEGIWGPPPQIFRCISPQSQEAVLEAFLFFKIL